MAVAVAAPIAQAPFIGLARFGLWLVLATSGLVYFEPAPFDLSAVALATGTLLLGMRIPGKIAPLVLLLAIILMFGLTGAMNATYVGEATKHITITAHLSVFAIVVASVFHLDPNRAPRLLIQGYVVAAVIAAAVGIDGALNLTAGAYDFASNLGRARGTFKDPNVFAPFLILPALYMTIHALRAPLLRAVGSGAVAVLLFAGIFLSFSRGAWGSVAVAGALSLILLVIFSANPLVRARILILTVTGAAALALLTVALVGQKGAGMMFKERFSLTQSYDVSGQGRFANQRAAIDVILDKPFGLGANEYARSSGLDPHNVYIKSFLMGGWPGGIAYFLLIIATLGVSVRTLLQPSPHRDLAIVLFSTFLVNALEGMVIDTDHWRHFYVLVGAIWGLYAILPDSRGRQVKVTTACPNPAS